MSDPLATVFDLTVLGTGLTESIVAAAAARCGLSVLHVDGATFYGDAESSLSLLQFIAWAQSSGSKISTPQKLVPVAGNWIPIESCEVVASAEDMVEALPAALAGIARQFTIDFSPRFLLSRGAMTELLVRSGVAPYVDFKAVNATMYVDSIAESIAVMKVSEVLRAGIFHHYPKYRHV